MREKENALFDPAGASGLYSLRYGDDFFNEPNIVVSNCPIGKMRVAGN